MNNIDNGGNKFRARMAVQQQPQDNSRARTTVPQKPQPQDNRKKIKNQPSTFPKRSRRVLAIGLVGTGILTGTLHHKSSEEYKEFLETSSADKIVEKMTDAWNNNLDSSYVHVDDEGNVIVDKNKCMQVNTLKVLQSTDLDEIINRYHQLKHENKKDNEYEIEQIEAQLETRKTELIEHNRNILIAIIADGSEKRPEDVYMDYSLVHRDDEEKEKIMNGSKASRGYVLRVDGKESTERKDGSEPAKYNFDEIPEILSKLIERIQLSYEVPNYKPQSLEELLKTNADLKEFVDAGLTISTNGDKVRIINAEGQELALERQPFTSRISFSKVEEKKVEATEKDEGQEL